MRIPLLPLVTIGLFSCSLQPGLESPDGRTFVSWSMHPDSLPTFTVDRGETRLLPALGTGLRIEGLDLSRATAMAFLPGEDLEVDFPVNANYARVSGRAGTGTFRYTYPGGTLEIDVRLFDDAFAFRYRFSGADAGAEYVLTGEETALRLPAGTTVWSAPDYEGLWTQRPAREFQDSVPVVLPLVAEYYGGYLAFTEAACLDYPAVSVRATDGTFRTTFQRTPTYQQAYAFTGNLVSPWRVLLINENLDGLVNNGAVYALNEPPDPALASADWIEPGRAAWTWISDGFVGQRPERLREQLLAAGALGWEYLIVDDGWEHWPDKWGEVDRLVRLGDSLGVKIMLWKPTADYQAAWQTAKFGPLDTIRGLLDPEYRGGFLDTARSLGVAGLKVDFVNEFDVERVNFVRTILRETAAREMVVNFHGASKPSGLERTYPNLLVYESVRGLEGTRGIDNFYHYSTVLPFTRYVIGGGDYTPVPGRTGNVGSRAHQLANAVNLLAPLNSFAIGPRRLLDLPEREFLESIPTTWDETRVLAPSAIGKVAVIAKRKGKDWYLGVAAGDQAAYFELPLAGFLGEGAYDALIIRDGLDADNFSTDRRQVNHQQALTVRTWVGGGLAARFTPR